MYSIPEMQRSRLKESADTFLFDESTPAPHGVSALGMTEEFSTSAPVSLYGATKLASEAMALEYGCLYNLPVWVNRCGVLAGAGQFGTAEQGIFSYWLHAHRARRRLGFFGFGGRGIQVRDALHPHDLAEIVIKQMTAPGAAKPGTIFHIAEEPQLDVTRATHGMVRSGSVRIQRSAMPRPGRSMSLGLCSIRRRRARPLIGNQKLRCPDSGCDRRTCEDSSGMVEHDGSMMETAVTNSSETSPAEALTCLSIVIPARDEEGCIRSTVEHLHLELGIHKVPHEIVVGQKHKGQGIKEK